MFNCISKDCLTDKENSDKYVEVGEAFPEVAFVTTYTSSKYNYGLPQIQGGAFESEYDAQQYCIDNSINDRTYSYYMAKFKPPTTTTWVGYPTYAYPTATRHNPNNYWDPQPPYVFASEKDASNFVATSSNENATLQYSNQYWIAKDTYNYPKHGFVGHKFFQPSKKQVVEPHQVIMPEVMKR